MAYLNIEGTDVVSGSSSALLSDEATCENIFKASMSLTHKQPNKQPNKQTNMAYLNIEGTDVVSGSSSALLSDEAVCGISSKHRCPILSTVSDVAFPRVFLIS